jgi:hypothetical protein
MVNTLGALALVLVGMVQSQQPPPQPTGTGRISGVVTRGDSKQSLEGAIVRIIQWEGGLGRQFPPAQTKADGQFTFENLPAGEYGVSFSAAGFVPLDLGQSRPQEPARRVTLVDGQHATNVDMTLPRTGAIEGRLLDEFGDPAPGMTVQAARVQYAAGKHRLMPVGSPQTVPTDDLGQFRLFNLPPGDYYLIALSGPFAAPEGAPGFALTYFPGTAVPMDAKAVTVDVGQDVTGVTMQMSPAPTSTISGVTTDENGTPIQATLMLVPTSGGDVRAAIMARGMSDPTGHFSFRNVAAGTYAIQGFGRPVGGGNLGRAPFGALQVTVNGDMSDLAVKISPGATLRGRIVFEGPAAQPTPERMRVVPAPINFATGPVGGGPPDTVTNADWTFETKNQTGTRVISASAGAAGWRLKSVTRDGKDITDQPVDFGQGDIGNVEITMTSVHATVTGTVTDAGQPVIECLVVIFPDDPAKWTFPSRFLSAVRPNPKGVFTASGLPSGQYLAIAIPMIAGPDWQDPAVLKEFMGQATRVNLVEGTSATVTLQFVRR